MKLNRTDLIAALDKTKPGLSTKEIIDQSICYVFHQNRIYTYNDEIAVSCAFDTGGVTCAVQAAELYDLLNRMKTDEIEVEFDLEGGEVRFQSGRTKAGIRLDSEIRMPLGELEIPTEWKKLPEKFEEGVRLCLFSCGKDMTRAILMCVKLSKGFAISSDNFRVTRYTFSEDEDIFGDSILFPSNSAKQIIPFNPVEFAETEGWLHLRTKDETVFSARRLMEPYPDPSKYLEVEGQEVQFPPSLIEALDRAKVFTKSADFKFDEAVEIHVTENQMTVRGEGDIGWLEEEVACEYSGEEMHFLVNPTFLAEILKRVDRAVVGEDVIKFQAGEFEHVMVKTEPDEE